MAPMVVMPPCARKTAWKNSTMIEMITVAKGPTMMAASGVPQGWEQEPVTGQGMCMEEITNTATPTMARKGL